MNRTGARSRIQDNQAFFLDNAQPIGPGQLQTAPPAGPAIAELSSVATLWGVNIKLAGVEVARLIAIRQGGAITAVDPLTGAITAIAPAATVTPACRLTVWQDGPVLFGDPTTGYFSWDGTTFLHYPLALTGDTTITSPTIIN